MSQGVLFTSSSSLGEFDIFRKFVSSHELVNSNRDSLNRVFEYKGSNDPANLAFSSITFNEISTTFNNKNDMGSKDFRLRRGVVDFLNRVLDNLSPDDQANLCSVSKTFREIIHARHQFWLSAFVHEGIPQVESKDGEKRDLKADFLRLRPITLSGKIIRQHLGNPVGPVPKIKKEAFDLLGKDDPFEPGKIGENYVFVVVPHLIQRNFGEGFPCVVPRNGKLFIITPELRNQPEIAETMVQLQDRPIDIPVSVKNLSALSDYPFMGQSNIPVFDRTRIGREDVQQEGGTNIYLMRKKMPQQSESMDYRKQVPLVQNEGFEVSPLLPTTLFYVIDKLRSGKYPNAKDTRSFARTSHGIEMDPGEKWPVAIGTGVNNTNGGIYMEATDLMGMSHTGVIPALRADVMPRNPQ